MLEPTGYIEIDLFPEDVNSLDHPQVIEFKRLLLEAAEQHDCFLISFEINHGTAIFSFDNDELTAKILTIIRNGDES